MFKNFLKYIVIASVLPVLAACGIAKSDSPGPMVSKTYKVAGFSSVDIAGMFDVQITTGTDYSMKVELYKRVLESLTVNVQDGCLVVREKDQNAFRNMSHEDFRIILSLPSLASVRGTGMVDFDLEGPVAQTFTCSLTGMSEFDVETPLSLTDLSVDCTGMSKFEFASITATGDADFNITGSSTVEGKTLTANAFSADVSGKSDVDIAALNAASGSVNASGMSSVKAMGGNHPAVGATASGMSSVNL